MKEAILAKVREVAERVALAEGMEVVEVELLGAGSRRLLRIYLDKSGGVSLGDCELVSRQVGTILDVEDIVPGGSYTLQVSSPGVERKLTTPRDFERFLGRRAKLLLRQPVESRRSWEGTLVGISGGVLTLEPAPGKTLNLDLAQIERANLKFDW